MPETSTTKSNNWLSLITDNVLAAAGAPLSSLEGADYAQSGSICTSRYSGAEPPQDAITTIANIR
jgi:hypothetical protein